MALKYEGKRLREVKSYRRKTRGGRTVYVESYYQRYDKPRGGWSALKADPITKGNRTVWLKDKNGRFVGRANSKGQTTAPKRVIAKAGIDRTVNNRERGRYGRIKGRTRGG